MDTTSTHTRCRLSSDEDSDGAKGPEVALQEQLRSARLLSRVALGLAGVAVATMLMVLRSSSAHPSSGTTDVVGLSALHPVDGPGWYRNYLDMEVHKEMSMDTPNAKTLPKGSLLYVEETRDQLVFLTKPMRGWVRIWSEDGVQVLVSDKTYKSDPNTYDFDEVARSREAREGNERVQQNAMKATEVQQTALNALHKLQAGKRHATHTAHQAADHAKAAHKAGEKMATQVVQKMHAQDAVDDIVHAAQDSAPHVQRAIKGAWVDMIKAGRQQHENREHANKFTAKMSDNFV